MAQAHFGTPESVKDPAIVKKETRIAYLHVVIMLILMFGIGFLPTFGSVTRLGMQVMGIFIGMVYGFITNTDFVWTSLLGLCALGFTGYTTVLGAFQTAFHERTIVTIILAFVYAGLIRQFDLSKWVSAKVLSSRSMIGKPWKIVTMIFLAGDLVTLFGSSIAATFLMWAITEPLLIDAGYEKGDKVSQYIMGGIVFLNIAATTVFPFHMAPVLYRGYIENALPGVTVDFVQWFIFFFILLVAVFVGYLLLGRFIFRLDLSKLATLGDKFADSRDYKATFLHKFGFASILAFLVLLMAPSLMPHEWGLTKFLNNFGIIGVVSLLVIILSIIRKSDGKPMVEGGKLFQSSVFWGLLFITMAILVMAGAMLSEDTGIMATITTGVVRALSNVNPNIFTLVSVVVSTCLVNIVNSGVILAVFINLLVPIADKLGLNAVAFGCLLAQASVAAYLIPASSFQAALLHGQEWVSKKKPYWLTLPMILLMLIVELVIGIPLGNLIF